MNYRLIAYVIILLVSGYVSFSIRRYGNGKVKFHMAVIDLITHIRQQITFYCMPTDRIINGYNDPVIGDIKEFVKSNGDCSIYTDERGRKILYEFFTRLGKTSTDDQIANCDYAISSLNGLLVGYIEEKDKKYKAYSGLAFVIGAMLVIILI